MISFNFITDESFRNSLESDYAELDSCISNSAWKSAHVLAGSIIEAILIDYLSSENIVPRDKALKMDFGEAIKICLENEIITAKTGDLCSVIKSYRNLIHPGRVIRLNEMINSESATVAKALVNIVVGEIEKKRRENYGYTAEQIVSKLESDPGAISIIPNLLSQSNPVELERLMLKILPETYISTMSLWEGDPPHFISAYVECFHTAFNLSSKEIKTKVARRIAKAFKEDSGETLIAYGTLFIRAEYFEYMNDFDLKLVKKYLLSKLKSNVNVEILSELVGIGKYLDEEDVLSFVDPLVRTILRSDNLLRKKTKEFFTQEMYVTSVDIDKRIYNRLDDWIGFYKEKIELDKAQQIEKLKFDINPEDIPF